MGGYVVYVFALRLYDNYVCISRLMLLFNATIADVAPHGRHILLSID